MFAPRLRLMSSDHFNPQLNIFFKNIGIRQMASNGARINDLL